MTKKRFKMTFNQQIFVGVIAVLLLGAFGIRVGLFNPLDRLVFFSGGFGTITEGQLVGIKIGDNIDIATRRLQAHGAIGPYRTQKADGKFYLQRGLPESGITYYYSDSSWRRGVIAITCVDTVHVSSISWRMCPTCP